MLGNGCTAIHRGTICSKHEQTLLLNKTSPILPAPPTLLVLACPWLTPSSLSILFLCLTTYSSNRDAGKSVCTDCERKDGADEEEVGEVGLGQESGINKVQVGLSI